MDSFIQMVEEPSQQDEVLIDEAKSKEFLIKVTVWELIIDYQKLSVDDRSSILKNYYVDMLNRSGSGSGKLFLSFWFLAWFCCCFLLLFLILIFDNFF